MKKAIIKFLNFYINNRKNKKYYKKYGMALGLKKLCPDTLLWVSSYINHMSNFSSSSPIDKERCMLFSKQFKEMAGK